MVLIIIYNGGEKVRNKNGSNNLLFSSRFLINKILKIDYPRSKPKGVLRQLYFSPKAENRIFIISPLCQSAISDWHLPWISGERIWNPNASIGEFFWLNFSFKHCYI